MQPSPPVSLRLPLPRYAAPVAGDVALGMALSAGFPALAADRVRRDVAAAVRAASAPLSIGCQAAPGRLRLRIDGAGDEALARAAAALDGHDARLRPSLLEVDFRAVHRGSLRAL